MLIIPEEDEFSVLNPIENNSLDFKKIIKTLFLPISIVAFIFLLVLLLISYFDKKQKEPYISNEIKQIFLLNNFVETTLYKENNSTNEKENKNEETSLKNELIKNLSYINYEGEYYENNSLIPNGLLYMQFSTNRNLYPDYFHLIIRIIKNNYIDNWMTFNNEIPFKFLKIKEKETPYNNNYILLEGEFDSQIEKGSIFKKIKSYSNCKITLMLNFISNENKSINYKDKIYGELKSKCENFQYDVKLKIKIKNTNPEKKTITIYSTITVIICLIMIINTNIIQCNLKNSEALANGVSLLTIYGNIVWNSYGCLCHFFLTINYPNYVYHFFFPTLFFFINFSITDLRFFYSIWRLKNQKELMEPIIIRKKLVKLYFMFYLGMFFSLFFVTKCFFYKPYIIIGIILTWTPQIIFNIYYNNRVALPWSYLIFTSIYRLFIPCYFRLNKKNFFLISPDYTFCVFIIILMFFQIYILYYQKIKGSRFFLPEKFRINQLDFYKNKEEILSLNPNANNIECVICLYPLFHTENEHTKYFFNDFISLGENEHVQILRDDFNIFEEKNNFYKKKIKSFFEFRERSLNVEGKKYIITPCKHFFHSKCLEMWFHRKRECPNCRTEINF